MKVQIEGEHAVHRLVCSVHIAVGNFGDFVPGSGDTIRSKLHLHEKRPDVGVIEQVVLFVAYRQAQVEGERAVLKFSKFAVDPGRRLGYEVLLGPGCRGLGKPPFFVGNRVGIHLVVVSVLEDVEKLVSQCALEVFQGLVQHPAIEHDIAA